MCSLCRLPVAKNQNFGQILKFGGLLYRLPFTDKNQIRCAETDPTSTLMCQISSENVYCVGFQWSKTTILGKFWHLRGSCTDPLLPMKVKFGVLKQTDRLHLRPNFIWICLLCRLPLAKNHNFGQILNFGGSCTGFLLPIRIKLGVLKQTRRLHLCAKFHLKMFIVSVSSNQKPQFWANFDIWGLLYRPPITDESQI